MLFQRLLWKASSLNPSRRVGPSFRVRGRGGAGLLSETADVYGALETYRNEQFRYCAEPSRISAATPVFGFGLSRFYYRCLQGVYRASFWALDVDDCFDCHSWPFIDTHTANHATNHICNSKLYRHTRYKPLFAASIEQVIGDTRKSSPLRSDKPLQIRTCPSITRGRPLKPRHPKPLNP